MEIRRLDRYLDELVLSDPARKGLDRVVPELREWEVLEANGLSPTTRCLPLVQPVGGFSLTTPAEPSTSTIASSFRREVASCTPATHGLPYSRATSAPC